MKRIIYLLAFISVFGSFGFSNNDSVPRLELSAKLVHRNNDQFRTYKIELRSGEELVNSIYSANNEQFTFLLRKNRQYSIRVFLGGLEVKRVLVSTVFVWEAAEIKRDIAILIDLPGERPNNDGLNMNEATGSISGDKKTRPFFFKEKKSSLVGEGDFDITKPKY